MCRWNGRNSSQRDEFHHELTATTCRSATSSTMNQPRRAGATLHLSARKFSEFSFMSL